MSGFEEFDQRARHYNVEGYYRDINRPLRAAYRARVLHVGDEAPVFALPTVDGGVLERDELVARGPVALVFGCYSAFPLVAEMPRLESLAARWRGRASVAFVYTREIHPGEKTPPFGKAFGRLTSFAEKLAHAREFHDDFGLSLPVAVDDLAGTLHRAFGELPFCQAVIDRSGTLVHRSEWASATLLEAVFENLAYRYDQERLAPARLSFSETLWCVAALPEGRRDRGEPRPR